MPETVRLHGMAYGGPAVGRLGDGAAVFFLGGLPGETVEIDLTERRKRFGRGRLVRILEPAAERTEPPCRHFLEGCGGCQWQFASYQAQVDYKQSILADQLARMGGIAGAPLLEPVAAPEPFRYRNVVDFHVRGGEIGLNREGSHELVDLQYCPLVEQPIEQALVAIRRRRDRLGSIAAVQVRHGADALQVTLVTDDDPRGYKLLAAQLAEEIGGDCRVAGLGHATNKLRGLHGDPWVSMELAGRRFRVSAPSFFQVNAAVAELLAERVAGQVRSNSRVIDLFSGVGTFGLLAAERAAEVVGVEESAFALADASANAAEAAAENVRFVHSDVGAAQALVEEGWDLTILDPPRSGCPRSILEALKSERIAYVSCDPSTLARDLRALVDRGFKLESVQLLDMFPQTYHIECLAVLSK
ncbi:MAG: class I SAM-dependent RNA methyltransferase [Chloroflexota bacterium]|nr:class I SAM-dependent RNA methyltransferase [Chloroflexota bacterium]